MYEYCKATLSPPEVKAYELIVRGLQARQPRINCGGVDGNAASRAWTAVYDDHPELFYMGHTASFQTGWSLLGIGTTVQMSFPYSDDRINDYERRLEKVKQDIRYMARRAPTDRDKVLMVAEYIVRNTVYAIDARYNQDAASSLCAGVAQCSGYSRAMKLLLDHLGVPCIYVTGVANGSGGAGPHAWNMVMVGSRFYHVDVTFMDGMNPDESGELQQIYLFYDDAKCAIDHQWDSHKYPACVDGGIASRSKLADTLWIPTDIVKRSPSKPASPMDSYDSNYHLETGLRSAIRQRRREVRFTLDMRLPPHRNPDDVVNEGCRNSLRKEGVAASYKLRKLDGNGYEITFHY